MVQGEAFGSAIGYLTTDYLRHRNPGHRSQSPSAAMLEVHERHTKAMSALNTIEEVYRSNYLFTWLDVGISLDQGYTICSTGVRQDSTLHIMGYPAKSIRK